MNKTLFRRIFTFLFLTVALMCLCSCAPEKGVWRTASGSVWATTYNIKYLSPRQLDDSIIATMRRVELALSPFDKDSEVSRINRGENIKVSEMVADVFVESKRINSLSNGAFDPTLAPLINLWGFGYDKSSGNSAFKEPVQQAIDSALAKVGIGQCNISSRGFIEKVHPGTEFDFSAITKGYGVDCVGRKLKECGVEDFIVEIGGEVVVGGVNQLGHPWRVQIDRPDLGEDEHKQLKVIDISKGGVATSGNYRNFQVLENGERVGHTISAVTGRPVDTEILSVTVHASTCMTADALATACMAMPLDDARAMIESLRTVWALFIVSNREDPTRYSLISMGPWPH